MRLATYLLAGMTSASLLVCAPAANAQSERFSVVANGTKVGYLNVDGDARRQTIAFDYKINGRGPSSTETLELDAAGLPVAWTIDGATTFGSKTKESFRLRGRRATWSDAAGPGSATVTDPSLYISQHASLWAPGLYARALLKDADREMPALPGGRVRLEKIEDLNLQSATGPVRATAWRLSGLELTPVTMVLDADGNLLARGIGRAALVREGLEGEERRLRDLTAIWNADWLVGLQKEAAHRYDGPVRVRNVRLFDPRAKVVTGPVSVVFHRGRISAVAPSDTPATPGETTIDGGGGTLVPGLFEMHGHLGDFGALWNVLAGVTTVRDMGSDNTFLSGLIENIDTGRLAGPNVIRAGMIEGNSATNNQTGFVVDSEAAAVQAVRWYAARGYDDIKIYSSIKPAWVPAMIAEARAQGMGVLGHVPAFTTADAMIDAGYDEITHINQLMLGWVLKPDEDTRTLLRLTALRRLPQLDLNSPAVQATLQRLIDRKVALDPTFVIHEDLTLNRTGTMPPGAADYFDHMPVGWRRDAMQALADASKPEDDVAYRGAFDQIEKFLTLAHRRGIKIVPGTDTGGAFTLHRELELYQRLGMTPAEILARATLEMAQHTGRDQTLGSIEKGKMADFFLVPGDPTKDLKAIKTIRMVVRGGVVYFPSEVYPKLGVRPFTTAPAVTPGG